MNPLLKKWTTPFETPPFNIIKTDHFLPAIKEAIRLATEEINHITDSTKTPDFENTIASLDRSGETLGKIASVLFNLNSADTTAFDSLPGIGPAKAQAIIDYRNSHGGFKNISELKNVKGIGDATFEKLKSKVTI